MWSVGAVIVVAGLALAACGGDDAPPATSAQLTSLGVEAASEEEAAYLDGVRAAFDALHGRQAALRETLNHRHSTPGAFFEAVEATTVTTGFAAVLASVGELDAPSVYAADHARLLAYLRDAGELEAELTQAVAARDVERFMVVNPRIGEAGVRAYLDLPSGLCNVVARGSERGFCDRGVVADDVYGAAVAAVTDRIAAEVLPRTAGPIGLLSPSAQFRAFRTLQAEIIRSLEEADTILAALTPPPGLRADHAQLRRLLGDLGNVVHGIYDATEDEDFGRYFEQTERLADVLCGAAGDFSAEFLAVVRVLVEPSLGELTGAAGCAS